MYYNKLYYTLGSSSDECGPPRAKRPATIRAGCIEVADFAWSSSRSLSADHKYDLLTNHFKPAASYSFPKTSGRSFQYQWLSQFPSVERKMVVFVYPV